MTFLRLVWILGKTHRKRGEVMLQFQLRINWFHSTDYLKSSTQFRNGLKRSPPKHSYLSCLYDQRSH
jgi:hypothetical protein